MGKMIKININNNTIESKVVREIKYFIKDLNYLCDIQYGVITIEQKIRFQHPIRLIEITCVDNNKIYKPFNSANDFIKIKTYGAAILGSKIAKMFEEYGYENIELEIVSDNPKKIMSCFD